MKKIVLLTIVMGYTLHGAAPQPDEKTVEENIEKKNNDEEDDFELLTDQELQEAGYNVPSQSFMSTHAANLLLSKIRTAKNTWTAAWKKRFEETGSFEDYDNAMKALISQAILIRAALPAEIKKQNNLDEIKLILDWKNPNVTTKAEELLNAIEKAISPFGSTGALGL